MLKNKRLLLLTILFIIAATVVLGMKIAYPAHRLIAFIFLGLGCIPLVISYRINRALLREHKSRIKAKTRPLLPHAIVALILLCAFYVTWVLFPVEKSPLTEMSTAEIRADLSMDTESYIMLNKASDDLVAAFQKNELLSRSITDLSKPEREEIRRLWRDGIMVFLEFDLLKEKYRGFYQLDYVAEPAIHSDAFFLVYMAYIAQYHSCIRIIDLLGNNAFMETLLNEEGEGIPPDTYFSMKQRLTHPNVLLRMNAAAAYFELVKKDITINSERIEDFERRRNAYVRRMGVNASIFVDNPLNILERAAFETVLPVQKNIAVQMSYIRTAKRDYLITPELIGTYISRLEPGDILIQRRNWHMTNIGIPGFWPHVALYVGTPDELKKYFNRLGFDPLEKIESTYPIVFHALQQQGKDRFPVRVIEAIRSGVVFQSLETSARCDYLGIIRPNLSKVEKFQALMNAFSHYGKDYDLNFDFTTDNELVCSELVYKAYKPIGKLPLTPEIVSGRRLLPPNRMAEQAVAGMADGEAFSFVLFLDAVEKDNSIIEGDSPAFKESWQRPKWDVMQK